LGCLSGGSETVRRPEKTLEWKWGGAGPNLTDITLREDTGVTDPLKEKYTDGTADRARTAQ
jgi:hypothetical protein